MSWQLLIGLSVILAVIRDSVTKKVTQHIHPLVSMVIFYIGSIAGATAISFCVFRVNPFIGGAPVWYMRLFGIFFGIGVYAMFEAMKINFTKFQIFGAYRNIISILLSFLFLGELVLFNPFEPRGLRNILGTIAFVVALAFGQGASRQNNQEQKAVGKKFLFWMFLNIILIGGALFFVKIFSQGIPPIVILTNQYVGSLFIISVMIAWRRMPLFIRSSYTALMFVNGIVTAGALTFLYMALKIGPIALVTPVENLLRTAVVIPVGLFFFKEARLFNKQEIVSLIIGFVGVVLLALP